MKGNVSDLRNFLEKELVAYALNKNECNKLCNIINQKHNISIGRIMDIIVQRVSMEEVDEFELYCFLEEIQPKKLKHYYTDIELQNYSGAKREETNQIKFPIKIKCMPVSYDSYIGVTDADFLMKLRSNQLINYNKNAQRNMEMVIRGEHRYYKISLNKSSVKEIKESFENGTFISNTITLNIPVDEQSDFYYDENNNELVINNIKAFDIADGYHRYVAMSQVKDDDSSWNYKMELRITNYSDDKTKNFMFQESKQTPMKRIDSDSLNMNSPANIVLERLNNDSSFVLHGNIRRAGGTINFAWFSSIIDYFYFKKKSENNNPVFLIKLQKDLCNSLNNYFMTSPNYIEHYFTFKELCVLFYGIYNKINTFEIMVTLNKTNELNGAKFANKMARKTLFTDIEELYKEWGGKS